MVSIARAVYLSKLEYRDSTYELAALSYWSAVEVNLPIICACLTTIRPLLNKLFPGLLGPGTSQYRVMSLATISASRKGGVGESRMTRCEEGGADGPASDGGSFVLMLHDVKAGDTTVEAPPTIYQGRAGVKSDIPYD